MKGHDFNIAGKTLTALGSGALWWRQASILTVSDLHLGKSERIARRGGAGLPPYETRETLSRLEADIAATGAQTVICLGDSFDDLEASLSLSESEALWITRLQAGRKWIWIEGNHDPGPVDFGGTHLNEYTMDDLVFRHIAVQPTRGEISGHFHPKMRLPGRARGITRPCFVFDSQRVVLPAYGAYTGGMDCREPAFRALFARNSHAITTGSVPHVFPLPQAD